MGLTLKSPGDSEGEGAATKTKEGSGDPGVTVCRWASQGEMESLETKGNELRRLPGGSL